jgi:hypothetical protein
VREWIMQKFVGNVNNIRFKLLGTNKLSGFVAHNVSGLSRSPRRRPNESDAMVTGDSDDAI